MYLIKLTRDSWKIMQTFTHPLNETTIYHYKKELLQLQFTVTSNKPLAQWSYRMYHNVQQKSQF